MSQTLSNTEPEVPESEPSVEIQVTPEPSPQTETVETPEPQADEEEFDPKKKVEFSTPEQQKKFNDVYKQMKMSDARNKMQADMLNRAMDQIKELETRFNQTDHAEAERILTSRLKEAREAGDEDKADKVLQEIIDFRTDRKISEKIKASPPVPVITGNDEDVKSVVKLASETDASGNLIRPWISDQHPKHADAMRIAGAIAVSVQQEYGYVDIEEVFKRMDEAVKPKKAANGNSRAMDPMGSNLTNAPTKGKMKLSPQEMAIAQKLGVKPEEYFKWKR